MWSEQLGLFVKPERLSGIEEVSKADKDDESVDLRILGAFLHQLFSKCALAGKVGDNETKTEIWAKCSF